MLNDVQRLSLMGVGSSEPKWQTTYISDEVEDIVWSCMKVQAAGKAAEEVLRTSLNTTKRLPFKAKFKQYTVTDPNQIFEALEASEKMEEIHTIVIDSLTYLMDMYESLYVFNATNGMKAWSNFGQYFKTLMQQYVAGSSKKVIFTAHTSDTLNESEMIMETKVPIKGAVKNNGVESYFSVVIACKKVPLKVLDNYKNDLLNITPEEEALGFKYVYQTKLTKETVNERLRGPLGLFENQETYIDNNIQLVLDRLEQYYND